MNKTLFFILITLLISTAGCSQAATSSPELLSTTPLISTHSMITIETTTPTQNQTISKSTIAPATSAPSLTTASTKTKPLHASRTTTSVPATQQKTSTVTSAATLTTTSTLPPYDWMELPVVPIVPDEILDIYKLGQSLGNDPKAFSKIGDCGSTPAWFLGDFDRGPRFFRLGDYDYLEGVIDYYQGSFDRTSLAARSGFNASALFVPLWADREYCASDESPLGCEYRNHKPSIAFIMLGANDVWHPQEFEPEMRKIIEYFIGNGVIPILSTKPDNQEADWSINTTMARLAKEYKIPLWNFWRATFPLPDHGLQEDGVHLTWGPNYFDDPEAMKKAWPLRNLTALQTLDAVWKKIDDQ